MLVNDTLGTGESLLAAFELDLDAHLRYASGLVVLTDRRILSVATGGQGGSGGPSPDAACVVGQWPLRAGFQLVIRDGHSVGSLELRSPDRRVAVWRYTAARAAGARRLIECYCGGLTRDVPGDAQASSSASGDKDADGGGGRAAQDSGEQHAREAPGSESSLRYLFRLAPVARRYWAMCLLGFGLTLAGTAAALIPPYLTMPLLDNVLIPYQIGRRVDGSVVKWYLLGLAGAAVLAWALSWAQMYVVAWTSERIAANLRTVTYSHLQRLSLEYFSMKRTGDLISRVGTDTDRICFYLSVYALDFGSDVIMLIMTAVILFSLDPGMAVVTLLPMPFIGALVFRVQGRLGRGFSVGGRAWADLVSILADTLPGIRVVKAFAQEQREIHRLQRANERVIRTNDRVNRVWAHFNAVAVLMTDAGVLVVWIAGVWRVFNHSITVGVLAAFVAYISRFYARLDSMSRMASATERAGASARRIFAILDRTPKITDPDEPVHPGRLRGALELRNASFGYAEQTVIRNLNLVIRPGEMIGLVGRSGAGKTTLINLLCRFFDVTSGAILADGIDIRRFPVSEFRRNIGLVLQHPFLFYGTVAENIAYGRPEAPRAEIIAAARAARAHEFILRLPHGYDSLVGEHGQFLSGGERQRLSIARALLIDPPILILDEATSSVDSETEREIQLALKNLTRGKTTIAIAHRLSTLEAADRLVVMRDGEIAEIGPHAELLARGGLYSRLYQVQLETLQNRMPASEGQATAEPDTVSKATARGVAHELHPGI